MPQLVIAAAGAALGAAALGTGVVALGMTGTAIGWAVGSVVGSMLFQPTQKGAGPRLADLSVTSSSYGTPIPYLLGSPRVAGQIIWASAKREIATTTEQGKGGGGSEYTSYTYEVDLLILLSDNEIPGVTRIWDNGKLIYNMSTDAAVATQIASNDTTHWTRLAVYTGDAAQVPDPTYETAVGAANAPAYRGRGTVFIESLQLGSSGAIPNLTFEIGTPWESDGLTRLQCLFAGGSSEDVSQYLIGPGFESGGVLTPGQYEITNDGTSTKAIIWNDAGLQRQAGQGYTMEFFVDIVEDAVNPAASSSFFGTNLSASIYDFQFYVGGLSGGLNRWNFSWAPVGSFDLGAVDAYGSYHVAIVISAADDLAIYVNGVRKFTYAGMGADTVPVNIILGGSGSAPASSVVYRYAGIRVRRAAMYTGATSSYPLTPEEWGLP